MKNGWTIKPVAGADNQAIELRGIGRADLHNAKTRDLLNALWLNHGVIIFRDVEDPDIHVELSECFGPCQVHPVQQNNTDPDKLKLTNVQYAPGSENGNVWEVDGQPLGAWLPFHFDLVYVDKVNHGGILRPIEIPRSGGQTCFLDKITLYDDLPDRLKWRVEGLEVAYRFSVDIEKMRFPAQHVKVVRMGKKFRDVESRAAQFSRSVHPLVYAQQRTGRKMLNLSPWFADELVGLERSEGDALLEELCHYVQTSKRVYCHDWKMGDLGLWDNWRVLHSATGTPPDCTRWMQRTTIAGDYSLGRLENESTETSELRLVDV